MLVLKFTHMYNHRRVIAKYQHHIIPTSNGQSWATSHKLEKQPLLLIIKTTENLKQELHSPTTKRNIPKLFLHVKIQFLNYTQSLTATPDHSDIAACVFPLQFTMKSNLFGC